MSPEAAELARALVAAPWWEWAEGMTVFPVGYDRERWLLCWCERRYLRRPDGTWPDEPSGWQGGAYQTSGGKWWGIAGSDDPIDLCDGWLPDLDDPGTAGVLLAMLPDGYALESPGCDGRGSWAIVLDGLTETHRGSTLGVAVARALLAVRGGA